MLFSLNIIIVFSFIFFFSGLFGFFFSIRSIFFNIIAIEVLTLTINLNFFFFSIFLNSIDGIIFVFYIIVVSACEICILLSYFILYLKKIKLFDSHESFKFVKF